MGKSKYSRTNPVPDNVKADIVASVKGGMKVAEVARKFGVSDNTVTKIVRDNGAPAGTKIEYPGNGENKKEEKASHLRRELEYFKLRCRKLEMALVELSIKNVIDDVLDKL